MRKILPLQSRSVQATLSFAFVIAMLFGCSDSVLNPVQTHTFNGSQARASALENEASLELVAQTLAKTLADPQVRSLIKNEAAKKIDGDFDVLYTTIAQRSIDGQTLAQKMGEVPAAKNSASSASIEIIAQQMPLLNISVPVHLDDWDVSNYEPLVVISPSSFVKDEKKLSEVKAYDRYGKIHYLDAKKAPSFPVIVVGLNERMEISKGGKPVSKKGLYFAESGNTTNLLVDPGNGGGGGGGTPTGGGGNNCSFSDGQYEYVDYIYCENGDAWEGWFDGGPEFYLTIGGYNGSSTDPNVRAQVLNGGNRVPFWGSEYHDFEALPEGKSFGHTAMIRWFASYGEILTYVWREEDTGGVVDQPEDVKVKWAGQEYSTNLITQLRSNDDFVTKQPVYRQDCSPFYYGSTTFRWKVVRN